MSNIKRLTIYVIYSADGEIDEYVYVALSELKKYAHKLIVVCNSDSDIVGKDRINEIADSVILRKNKGYDAGAFKDALSEVFSSKKFEGFDEILLTNDSWYGPFWSLDDVFFTMDGRECDYWSMTKHPEVKIIRTDVSINYPAHYQSYFISFRKKVIESVTFKRFWEKMEYASNLDDAIRDFEVGINACMSQNGFVGISYMEVQDPSKIYETNINPYIYDALRLVKNDRIPLLKHRAFDVALPSFSVALEALAYVRDNTSYNTDLIENSLRKRSKHSRDTYDWNNLEKFYSAHDKIYIYGAGRWGKNLAAYFKYKKWKFEGFVQTEAKEGIISFSDLEINENMGFVIAVAKREVGEQIKRIILERVIDTQVFLPKY